MFKHTNISEAVIGAFYKVYNNLGHGFLEKVYEAALCIELTKSGLNFEQQYPVNVYYNDQPVGSYICDIIVEQKIIIEIKAVTALLPIHEAQLLNYLKATRAEVGLLLNFGTEPQVKRKAFSNPI